MNLALIIPARDEQDAIARVLESIPKGLAQQIIVVDNGSRDETAVRARQAGAEVVSEPRHGYGQACRTGLGRVRGEIDVVGFLDADGSDTAAELITLFEPIRRGETDFVLSARVLAGARENLTPQQRFGNWLACFLIQRIWHHRYTDLGPMRVIRRDCLDRLGMVDATWGWTVEMQIKAVQHRLRIRQIPVPYGRRLAGRSKISGTVLGTLRAGGKILATIARLYFLAPDPAKIPAAAATRRHGLEALESTRL